MERFSAAAARRSDAPLATNAFTRSRSSAVQIGLFPKRFSAPVRRRQFGRCDKPGIRQAAQRPIAALRALKNSARNMPAGWMFLTAHREGLTGALKRDFHISQCSGIKTLCNHAGLAHGTILLWRFAAAILTILLSVRSVRFRTDGDDLIYPRPTGRRKAGWAQRFVSDLKNLTWQIRIFGL
jgi:hypothetical protein